MIEEVQIKIDQIMDCFQSAMASGVTESRMGRQVDFELRRQAVKPRQPSRIAPFAVEHDQRSTGSAFDQLDFGVVQLDPADFARRHSALPGHRLDPMEADRYLAPPEGKKKRRRADKASPGPLHDLMLLGHEK